MTSLYAMCTAMDKIVVFGPFTLVNDVPVAWNSGVAYWDGAEWQIPSYFGRLFSYNNRVNRSGAQRTSWV